VAHFGPICARRLDSGIRTRSSSQLLVGRCICGVLSMMTARSSTSWARRGKDAALRLMRKLLKHQGLVPTSIALTANATTMRPSVTLLRFRS
jgi:hypothetical protein